jgi:DNA topoisomerase-1
MTYSYTLLIVESPAKCKKIEQYLGTGYKCIASFGHIRELKGLKNIDIASNFHPTFETIKTKSQQIKKMRESIKQAKKVILATDDDREGEAIAWHICRLFKLPIERTPRIIFHEITKPAIQRAVQQPTFINMDIVHAQQARQILDVLMGFKISPLLWKYISRTTKQGLSAGRCQTPALRLVYENQKEIDVSPGKKIYQITGYFTKECLPFTLNKVYSDQKETEDVLIENVDHNHVFKKGITRNTKKTPPEPFTTSILQQKASNELHMSPKETMKHAQKLYEGGYITYMRTDSKFYSPEFIEQAKNYIENEWGNEYIKEDLSTMSLRKKTDKTTTTTITSTNKTNKTTNKKTENVQEAHEAIRPTKLDTIADNMRITSSITPRAKKLYHMIWCNTIESCMKEATYKCFTSTITSPRESEVYKYNTEHIVFPGWKIVKKEYEKKNQNNIFNYLKSLKNGTHLPYEKIRANVTLKELRSHYSEAKLVQLLEKHGIGRPSTFSSLVDKIQSRGYVKKTNVDGKKIKCIDFELIGDELEEIENERVFGNEKNKLVLQPTGLLVIEFLLKHFNHLFDYEYTNNMENALDIISQGRMVWHRLCKTCLQDIEELTGVLKQEQKNQRQTIQIDENHVYMIAKYGPVVKYVDPENKDNVQFKQVREDIDMDKLRQGEYTLDEIIDKTKASQQTGSRILGVYEDQDLFLKKGRYGLYASWGDKKCSLKGLEKKKRQEDITIDDVLEYIKNPAKKNPNALRIMGDYTSIRKSKYGLYIFHQTPNMKKPSFHKLKSFKENPLTCDKSVLCDWIEETYGISTNDDV